MIRALTLLVAAAGATAALPALLAAAPEDDTDYTSLPPEPAAVARALSGYELGVGDAIERVESELGARAYAAEHVDPLSDESRILVRAFADGERFEVEVDPSTGALGERRAIPRFAGWPVEGEPTRTESGLAYWDVEEGTGASPSGSFPVVRVHYTGWLVTGEKFDSSHDRGEPARFPLGQVIKGWQEGVGSMKVGGRRKLVVPHELGYGERGSRGTIPPRATLIFDVELLEVVK